jgi:hypothetical protein
MKLKVPHVDLRGGYSEDVGGKFDVVDEETGKIVGFLHAYRSPRVRHISLFAGKYSADLESHEQCAAFAKGVEAVLNHLMDTDELQQESHEDVPAP